MTAGEPFDVLTIGSATEDVFLTLADSKIIRVEDDSEERAYLALEYGAKIRTSDVVIETGGGATNTAVTFAPIAFLLIPGRRLRGMEAPPDGGRPSRRRPLSPFPRFDDLHGDEETEHREAQVVDDRPGVDDALAELVEMVEDIDVA